jgi:glucose/mannose transport system substrate-binding protein
MRKLSLFIVVIALLALAGCQPQTVEVTRVVTETVTEQIEVTRIVEGEVVTEIQEVEVTRVVEPTAEPEAPELEIFHWWTGPGERQAADAMFAALNAAYPEVTVVENPVAGGGGVSHRVVLQGRMAAGLPPDTFQTLGGAELKQYVDGGALEPLDDLYAELGYADVIPGPLLNAVSIDGHPYVVPLNMHIQNILYYNKTWFDELGLEGPKNFDELMAACDAIKAAGYTDSPLGLGTVENWEAPFVLDSIILELGGPEYYVSLYKGEIDVTTDPIYRESLEKLAQLTDSCVYPDHAVLTWDQSVGLVSSEDAAMVIMGTWAIGAFISNGWEPGVDFGAVTFPQEPDRMLLFHPDTYGLAAGAPHPEATKKWLEVVASPELQIPTDVTQGGMFARTDIDPTEFPDPIRQEMQTFVSENPGNLILDQHGSIAPASFSNEYWIVIASLMSEENPDIDSYLSQVDALFQTYNVKDAAAWYQWP